MEGCFCGFWFVRTIIVLAVSLLMLGSQADASATLELLMVRFDNPRGKRSNGNDCDMVGQCDHVFRFSLDRGNSSNISTDHLYWSHTTGDFGNRDTVHFGQDMKGVRNPIVTPFRSWPSIGVKFKVYVKDSDTVTSDDHVDNLVQLLRLTPALDSSTANWTTIVMVGTRRRHKTMLTIKHKLYCDANYYSADCSVHCIANDTDSGGHYSCDPITGNIVCRPGWEDESTSCNTFSNDCLNHTCENGATCVDGVRTYTCLCPPGYTDISCETDVNECASNPCQQGGTCEDHANGFTCSCPSGFTGKLCSEDQRSTTDSAITDEVTSSQTWLYALIAVVICVVLLVVLALILFICMRRRKRAKASENQPPTTSQSPSAPDAPPSPPPPPPAAASYSVATDDVNIHVNNNLYFIAEEPTGCNRGQADINRNVYETIQDVPPKPLPVYDGLSTSKPSQPQSPPKAAAAAVAAMYDVVKDDVHFAATSDSNGNACNFYDTIEDVPTTSPTSSTRMPPGQSLTGAIQDVPPKPLYDDLSTSKPSQPQSPPKAAAAAAIYDVIKDDVHFAETSDSNRNTGNFYDTIENVPTTSPTSSTRTPPEQSLTGADSVYLHVQPRSLSTSPPSEPTSLSPSPVEPAAAAGFYESMDRPHLGSSSASPPPSSSQPTPPSSSQPTPPPSQSAPEANNVYIPPSTSNSDVRPCSYELERVPTKPTDGAYANQ